MKWIKEKIYRFLELDKFVYNEIFISKNVIYRIGELAKNSYPKEVVAFLKGKISNKRLIINDLVYQHFKSNFHSASIENRLPLTTDVFGSVHSHPSYSNMPSNQDLEFFGKNGTLHLIICKPFNLVNVKAYNSLGKETKFTVY
ncbi:MAG: Mov34/MPN/PAD-1 family protein [Nanoarchaeota archaeon]